MKVCKLTCCITQILLYGVLASQDNSFYKECNESSKFIRIRNTAALSWSSLVRSSIVVSKHNKLNKDTWISAIDTCFHDDERYW